MDRLQPDRIREPNPDAEDEAVERARQIKLDDEIERDYMRQQAEDNAVATTKKLLAIDNDMSDQALRVLYRLGVMAGALRMARA